MNYHYVSRDTSINRAEAVAVLRALMERHEEIAFSELVDIRNARKGAELRFKCALDTHGREIIKEFLKERSLKIREENGFVIIYE